MSETVDVSGKQNQQRNEKKSSRRNGALKGVHIGNTMIEARIESLAFKRGSS